MLLKLIHSKALLFILLGSMILSTTGVASVSHVCLMKMNSGSGSSCEMPANCCNKQQKHDDGKGCCSNDIVYFRADLDPAINVSDTDNLINASITFCTVNTSFLKTSVDETNLIHCSSEVRIPFPRSVDYQAFIMTFLI